MRRARSPPATGRCRRSRCARPSSGITRAGTPLHARRSVRAARPSALDRRAAPAPWLCSSSAGVAAAGARVGRQQRAHAPALSSGARRRVGQRAARAHGGAGAAAHAQVRLDDDAAAARSAFARRCGSPAPSRRRCRRCSRSARCGCARTASACSGRTSASRTRRPARAACSTASNSAGVVARRGSSPAAAGAARRPARRRRSSTRSKRSLVVCGARSKSIAPAASQARTQSRWLRAAREVDLVAEVDRLLGADRRCRRCSACTGRGRSGCALSQLRLEGAEPAGEARRGGRRAPASARCLRQRAAGARSSSRLTSSLSASIAAARSAASARADHQHAAGRCGSSTVATGSGVGQLRRGDQRGDLRHGAASRPCDQPPVSRMLTKRIGRSCSARRAFGLRRSARRTAGFPACRPPPARRRPWPRAGTRRPRAGTAVVWTAVEAVSARVRRRGPAPAPGRPAASSGCSRRSGSVIGRMLGGSAGAAASASGAASAGTAAGRRCASAFARPRRRTGPGTATAPSGAASTRGIGSGLP